ncbi:hypothetical protein [Cellulosimicrobium sp. SH8]|uniref:hypothetical protein n=1 Tax=Cellulosimicrobium sp. SH8 TaxID=2952936 RepID=UPI0021F2A150|nr:hypothetical protein [Cellulosimicrobium sp. SH8]
MDLEPSRYGCSAHRQGKNTEVITAAVRSTLKVRSAVPPVLRGTNVTKRQFEITVRCPGKVDSQPDAPHDVVAKGVYTFLKSDWDDVLYDRAPLDRQ